MDGAKVAMKYFKLGDTIGYANTDTLRTTRIPVQPAQESDGGSSGDSSDSSGGSNSGGGGSNEWTPPAM